MPVLRMSDKGIAGLVPPERGQLDYYDDVTGAGAVRGLILKISHGGTRSFYLLVRPEGVKGSRQIKLGSYPALRLSAAREKARELQSAMAKDSAYLEKEKAREAKSKTFAVVAEEFRIFHVEANKLRTGKVIVQQIKKHLLPKLKDRPFSEIRRGEINSLLNDVQRRHGLPMRSRVYTVFKSIASHYLQQDEDYRSPIVRNMRGYKAKKRKRVLSTDAEIKAFWSATAKLGTFGAMSRIAFLTGARRTKVNHMKWADINDGVWDLGHELNEKKHVGMIRLTALALSIIQSQPRLDKNPFVFPASRGRGPFSTFAPMQKKLISLMRQDVPDLQPFVFHDLRRSMRTLASRIGIERDLAERMIGHTVGNELDEIYDQHAFADEMAVGFAKIAQAIEQIVSPAPAGNVVRMERRARQRGAGRPASHSGDISP